MLERRHEPRLVIPALVERFENVAKLRFAQAVKACDDGVELMNHALLFSVLERAVLDTDCFRPLGKAPVHCGEPPGQSHSALPQWARPRRPRTWKRAQHVVIHVKLN